MSKSIKNLSHLLGIFLIAIGLYDIIRQLIDTGSLSFSTPVICLFLGGCSWAIAYFLGLSLTQDQTTCERSEVTEEAATEESD
ncbi:MAG: hypothetical protein Q8J78_08645 [Moraxellaceae bacterium]|nr:hypothetical protein [Moraxellaceae bacterium]